jgi:hypothetical protein
MEGKSDIRSESRIEQTGAASERIEATDDLGAVINSSQNSGVGW